MMEDAWTKSIESLRKLEQSLEPSVGKHERAIVLIHACILHEIDTGTAIISALQELGFNKRHVGIWLAKGTGNDPERHFWSRDEDGKYHSHDG